jgi:hypothetical protein
MSESLFASSRTFRVWLYAVSHSTLLLRSVKEAGISTRIDVLFKPVRYMSMPMTLSGIDLRIVTPAALKGERADIADACGPKDKIFALAGDEGGAWVISGVME